MEKWPVRVAVRVICPAVNLCASVEFDSCIDEGADGLTLRGSPDHDERAVTDFGVLQVVCVAAVGVIGNAASIMNKKKLASLPPDIQKIIREVGAKYCEVYAKVGVDADKDTIKKLNEAKIEIFKFPLAEMQKMKALALPIWEKYIADNEAKGLPGKAVATEFVKALRELGEDPPYRP